jgi:hypothetical protein
MPAHLVQHGNALLPCYSSSYSALQSSIDRVSPRVVTAILLFLEKDSPRKWLHGARGEGQAFTSRRAPAAAASAACASKHAVTAAWPADVSRSNPHSVLSLDSSCPCKGQRRCGRKQVRAAGWQQTGVAGGIKVAREVHTVVLGTRRIFLGDEWEKYYSVEAIPRLPSRRILLVPIGPDRVPARARSALSMTHTPHHPLWLMRRCTDG